MTSYRSRWAAIGAAVAVTLGAGGISLGQAAIGSGDKPVFVAIEPCRLVDTRPGDVNIGGRTAPLSANDTLDLQVTGSTGQCIGIPADATAAAMNVTAIQGSARSYLSIYPADATLPNASNLNWNGGDPPTPNKVDVALSPAGSVKITNNAGTVHVAADLVGYYIDHHHDDRYYTETEIDAALAGKADADDVYTRAEVDGAIAASTAGWMEQIALGSLAEALGITYNRNNFSGPVGLEMGETTSRLSGTVMIPSEYEIGTDVRINLDLMPGTGSTAPCTVDLNMTSADTFLTRPGAVEYSLIRSVTTLDVTLADSVPVRSFVSFPGGNGFQPGDSLAFTISRDHDSVNDSCAGEVVVTGMSLTPATP
jgi:hypothetical protein